MYEHLSLLALNLNYRGIFMLTLKLKVADQLLCTVQLSLQSGHLLALPRVVVLQVDKLVRDALVFVPHSACLRLNAC